jgi:hypothetical protein
MAAPTHTPGPWRVVGRTAGYRRLLGLRSAEGEDLLVGDQLEPRGVSIAQAEANARLMSAAPDMLVALRAVLDYLPDPLPNDDEVVLDMVRGAIAKAVRP